MKKMTFVWEQIEKWLPLVVADNDDLLGEAFLHRYRAAGSTRIYADDLSRFRAFFTGIGSDPVAIIDQRFSSRFSKIRAYHGCAPTEIQSYYTNGILPLAAAAVNEQIRQEFLNSQYPEITPEILAQAISETGTDMRKGRLFLALDARSLLDCGHYLRYGSEYRTGIAAAMFRITRVREYRLAFRDRGKPTIFTCDVPIDIVDASDRAELIAKIVMVSISSRTDTEYVHYPLDFTIKLGVPVAPTWVVTHTHPEGVRDPLQTCY
jgi:hypothetical protein